MSILQNLRNGSVPAPVRTAAKTEHVGAEHLADLVQQGLAAVPANPNHTSFRRFSAIGKGLRTKVNANIGNSEVHPSPADELEKLDAAVAAGADTVMDLSTAGDIGALRRLVIERSPVAVGTVPAYEVAVRARRDTGSTGRFTTEFLFEVVEEHAKDGADFMTLHCGVTRSVLAKLDTHPRVTNIVSRGGALLARWMRENDRENPLYENYDRLLDICRQYEVTISLGDGLRPGSLADAGDPAQYAELDVLGNLVLRAREADVQTIVEGPGHVPLDQVEKQMQEAKRRTHDAPLYVLGPLVTDVGAGHDHVTAAIGGSLAALHGADFLCYVTPREHLGLPTKDDVHKGVAAARIAGHAADVARGIPGAAEWDEKMSRARRALDWDRQLGLALDEKTARSYYEQAHTGDETDACSMCGELCAFKNFADDDEDRPTARPPRCPV